MIPPLGRDYSAAIGLRSADRAALLDFADPARIVAQNVAQDLLRMLAKKRRARHVGRAIRQFDRIADGEIFSPRRMIDLDHRAGGAQRLILGKFLHGKDGADRDIDGIAEIHHLELGLGHRPLLDAREDSVQLRQASRGSCVFGIGLPGRFANEVADFLPHRRLGDEIDVRVGVLLPALAFQDAAGLAAAGIVAGARHGRAEGNALAELAVFLQRSVREPLLVAQFHAREVQHAVLHRAGDPLPPAGLRTLIKRGHDAEREMQPGTGIADLCAGDQRRAVAEAGGRGRAAGALRDVLIDLAVLVRARAEAFDRGDDHLRVEPVDRLPGEAHAIEHARSEILDQHVAFLDQALEHFLARRVLGVERDRAFVVVQHGEVQAVHLGDVLQLPARDVARSRALDLDHVGAKPCEELRAGRSGLDMGEVKDANAF